MPTCRRRDRYSSLTMPGSCKGPPQWLSRQEQCVPTSHAYLPAPGQVFLSYNAWVLQGAAPMAESSRVMRTISHAYLPAPGQVFLAYNAWVLQGAAPMAEWSRAMRTNLTCLPAGDGTGIPRLQCLGPARGYPNDCVVKSNTYQPHMPACRRRDRYSSLTMPGSCKGPPQWLSRRKSNAYQPHMPTCRRRDRHSSLTRGCCNIWAVREMRANLT